MQIKNHKKAKDIFNKILANPENFLIVHYSCESFIDQDDGRTPRITTIAVKYFESNQTQTFSIHEVAEQQHIPIEEIENHYNQLEKMMLDEYFEFVRQHSRYRWIHWNMRDNNYGFYAIENRYKILGGTPFSIQNDNKIDLSRLLGDYYGRNYIDHPKMEKLITKNGFSKKEFLTGAEEAKAFEEKQYIKLRNSTLRKVHNFSNIIYAVSNNTLKTNSTWKMKYGISIQGSYEALKDQWWFNALLFVLGVFMGVLIERYFFKV